jgi:hypothetical protein
MLVLPGGNECLSRDTLTGQLLCGETPYVRLTG